MDARARMLPGAVSVSLGYGDWFEFLVDSVQDIITVVETDGTILYESPSLRENLGYDPHELIGRNAFSFVPEEELPALMERLRYALSHPEEPQSARFRFRHANGTYRFLEARAKVITSDAGSPLLVVSSRDVTDRVAAERALKESESRFRALFENSPDAVFVEDMDGYVLDVNPAGATLHRTTRAELIGAHVTELVPESVRDSVREQFAGLADATSLSMESESLALDGTVIPVEIRINPFTFGSRPALLLTVRDISRRREVEAELARLENFYRTILDHLPADLAVMDRDGRMIYLNPASVKDPEMRAWLIGKTGHDYCRKRGLDTAIADERISRLREAIDGRKTVTFYETLADQTGRTRHILRLASPIIEPDGQLELVIGYGLDITDLTEAQAALRESEMLLRSVLGNMPAIVVAVGPTGTVRMIEGEHLELMGLTPGGYVGRSIGAVFNHVPEVVKGFRKALDGTLRTHRVQLHGHTFEFCYNPLHTMDGSTVTGAVAVATDVTNMVRQKAALRESQEQLRRLANRVEAMREEDRARIAREVHDVLGQAMTGLRMDIAWLDKYLENGDGKVKERISDMTELITEAIQNIRKITTDLRPGVLDDLGLAAAIQWQAKEFESRTEIACIVSDETDEILLDSDRSTAVFRIFQEILTNVVRHSEATVVEILLRQERGFFEMRVADDGIGIRFEDLEDPRSLGLLGIRERVAPWGGRVSFEGQEDEGTVVTVSVPFT